MKRLTTKEIIERDWQQYVDYLKDNATKKDSMLYTREEIEKFNARLEASKKIKLKFYNNIPCFVSQSEKGSEFKELFKFKDRTYFSSELLEFVLDKKINTVVSVSGNDYRNNFEEKMHEASIDLKKYQDKFIDHLKNGAMSLNGGSCETFPQFIFLSNYGYSYHSFLESVPMAFKF